MSSIQGDLSVLGFANLLQAFTLNRCEGYLTLELGAHRKILYLHPGGVRLVRGSRRCLRLEKLLRRIGTVASEGPSVEGGAPSRGAIARLVQEWMLEEICDVFTWTRGTFRFQQASEFEGRESVPSSPFSEFAAESDLMTVVLEAARRTDEMPRIRARIPDLQSVPERADSPDCSPEPSIDEDALRDVLPLVDGRRTVSEIVQVSAYPRLAVLEVLYRLSLRGALRIPAPHGGSLATVPEAAHS